MKNKRKIQGKLSLHPKGFGFVHPDSDHEDIFIPPTKMNGAFDGDIVSVESLKKGPKGWEGLIVKVVKSGRSKLVGTVVDFYENGDAMIFAPTAGEEHPLVLKKIPGKKFRIGDRVSVKVAKRNKQTLYCTLIKFFGNVDNGLIDSEIAIDEFEIADRFPEEAVAEAKSFPQACPLTPGRHDFRHLEVVTIDPKTARDYDDALSLTKDKKGHYFLGVHIADVSHYVVDGSHLDQEAFKRGNSTYFIDKVVPMLPEQLSNDLCSLREGVDRYTASVMMEFDPDGNLLKYEMVKGLIRSRKRFSYEEAKQVLDGEILSPHLEMLKLLVELCHHLKNQKKERGCVELHMSEIRLTLDETGTPYMHEWIPYDVTHQLVEEFMLKANEMVATELLRRGDEGIFRVHEVPDKENLEEFYTLARLLGYRISNDVDTLEISRLFEEAKNSPFIDQLSQRYIRTMKLAIYSNQNIGHYGLNLENYTHFTSPIRRYTDLVVHRLLFEKDYHPKLDVISQKCSDAERKSFRAEMSVLRLKKLRYLDRLTEKNPDLTFQAVITNIKPQGIFFDISLISFDAMIHVSELGNDYYNYSDKERSFVGSDTRERFQIGSQITVQLETIDLVFGECTWTVYHNDN